MSPGPHAHPESPTRRRLPKRVAVYGGLLAAVPLAAFGAATMGHAVSLTPAAESTAAQPFEQSVTSDGTDTTWTFSLKDRRPLGYVGVNFTPKGQGQQSLEMKASADGKTWTLSRPAGVTTKEFTYFFVYKKAGANVNEPTTPVFDQSGRPAGGPSNPPEKPVDPPAGGSFPLKIVAKDSDRDDYVTIVGQATPGRYSYVTADGGVKPVTDQPNGMSFPLKSLAGGTVSLPPEFQGGRIFLSKKPLSMPPATSNGAPSDVGYVQPDLNNPADPNQGNPYDFFEFTFKHGAAGQKGIHFGGNTTQVDGFSLPMTATLKQESSGYEQTVGIQGKSAAEVIASYKKFVGADSDFAGLVDAAGTHISAPRSAKAFQGPGAHYFDSAVNSAWSKWGNGFKLVNGADTYEGRTEGGRLSFKKSVNGKPTGESGSVGKPTTPEVAACNGALSTGSDMEKFVEAHLCAAFNRGITQNDPSTWKDPKTYYPAGATSNKYAAFFHKEGLRGLAYGFAYDDVHDQSSVMILPNANAPTSLTLRVG
ncbi:beta-1,3-glucanase family protein [Streptomyces sp. NPDC001594]|uniref:beta-1,3-glucanase family protein n=1 Tax=Streptomyces sp. NPDC001594 TaxID=3364590 RepID=UPI0036817BD8